MSMLAGDAAWLVGLFRTSCGSAPMTLRQRGHQGGVGGRLWDGKEAVLEAIGALALTFKDLTDTKVVIPDPQATVKAVVAATERKKSEFRKAAVKCLKDVLTGFAKHDLFMIAGPPLLDACARLPSEPKKDPSNESTGAADKQAAEDVKVVLPLAESLECLEAAWSATGEATMAEHAAATADALREALKLDRPWAARSTALATARTYVEHLAGVQGGGSSDGSATVDGAKAAQLSAQRAGFAVGLIPSVMENMDDGKVSQVRIAALEWVQATVPLLPGGMTGLPQDTSTALAGKLDALTEDKASAVRGFALRVREGLGGQAPMAE
ncbi:hypothetical protein CYMTET_26980 [Cymbomonas tetramitiformis]|uniref:Uncharacterized protein n=1 Tax=Cymbomonas tetramitiformis TaxID=36881 RepID=A0AAE0KXD2_9CHLO|nr:hypothetical protein CYMTET_26980 [Cymbomonas tetramitiformis]